MLRKIAIALAAGSLVGAASIPTDALAFGRGGGGGGHAGFGGGGFGHRVTDCPAVLAEPVKKAFGILGVLVDGTRKCVGSSPILVSRLYHASSRPRSPSPLFTKPRSRNGGQSSRRQT